MPTVKLTKSRIEGVPAGDRDVILWDTEAKGFGCKITPTGRRVYLVKYRVGGGRQGRVRKPMIGSHGEITVDQARKTAREWLAEARKGNDPGGDRQAARNAPTVAALADRYMAEHAEPHKKPSSVKSDRRLIEANIKPRLGGVKAAAVQRSDVTSLHHAMRATPYEANRTVALLSKMFSLAEVWGLRPDGSNPCRHVKRFRERKRERFFTDGELKKIGKALADAERTATELPGVVAAIRLLALTGCRLGEVIALRWDEVDMQSGLLMLSDAKAGAREVPLGERAISLLSKLPRSGPYVVHGSDPSQPLSRSALEKAWARLRERAGINNARLHDFRHTVGTYAGQAGLNAFIVRDLLGHKTLAMAGRYVERDIDPVREAANHVDGRVGAALSGKTTEVVRLADTSAAQK
jgi:integrase